MKIRIAIIAACAGTFALAQTNPAPAAYAGADVSKREARSDDVGARDGTRIAIIFVGGSPQLVKGSDVPNPPGQSQRKKPPPPKPKKNPGQSEKKKP